MASNFKPWVDSPTAGQQVQSASVFATDAQRVNGFKAGDPASALRVNSALRQANIVVAGLMQMCDDIKTLPSELSLMSTVTQVKNAIKAAIDQLDATVLASAKSYTDTREGVINGKITNVQNQVTSNKNRLDALEPRVDDLENGNPNMTVGKAEMLTEPFAVGFDTATVGTGYVKFASVSLPAAYQSASTRFEVLDKNSINVQTNMCGVEVVARNMSATDVVVTVQLLYGSSQYLSKIYACVKKGTYPVIVDLYFNITSNNAQETISCIKPLFTFARGTGTSAFTFITDNVVVTNLPTDTTNTQLSTAYTTVTEAKTAENAENATNDGDGKNIASTYARKTEISNPNLLINPGFSINQRGQKTYTGNDYTVDRWRGGQSTSKVSVGDNGLTLSFSQEVTSGAIAIQQKIDIDPLKLIGKTISISAKISSIVGKLWYCRIRYADSKGDFINQLSADILANGIVSATGVIPENTASLTFQFTTKVGTVPTTDSLTVEWAKVELGGVATEFVPPLIAEELLKCQRYYCKIKKRLCSGYSSEGLNHLLYITIPFSTTMRAQPSIKRTDDWLAYFGGMNVIILKTKTLVLEGFDGNSITYNISVASYTEASAFRGCAVEVTNVEFDAEL